MLSDVRRNAEIYPKCLEASEHCPGRVVTTQWPFSWTLPIRCLSMQLPVTQHTNSIFLFAS